MISPEIKLSLDVDQDDIPHFGVLDDNFQLTSAYQEQGQPVMVRYAYRSDSQTKEGQVQLNQCLSWVQDHVGAIISKAAPTTS